MKIRIEFCPVKRFSIPGLHCAKLIFHDSPIYVSLSNAIIHFRMNFIHYSIFRADCPVNFIEHCSKFMECFINFTDKLINFYEQPIDFY